jgi:hypothetical protein
MIFVKDALSLVPFDIIVLISDDTFESLLILISEFITDSSHINSFSELILLALTEIFIDTFIQGLLKLILFPSEKLHQYPD